MTKKIIKTDAVLIDNEEYYVENHDPGVINIQKAINTFDGDLSYVGYWFVKDAPAYVFHSANPDVSKGHKEYLCIKHVYDYFQQQQKIVLMGYTREQMEEMSVQAGTACRHCKTIIWSLTRHDYHGCRCEEKDKSVAIDGGMSYFRKTFGNECDCFSVTVNHLTRTITRVHYK